MQSRMDKYSASNTEYKSRTQRNKSLYEDVKNSALNEFDVNSNVSVIDDNASSIDISKLGKILDEKYNDYAPKRRSIEVPAYEDEPIVNQPLVDTKEYDINAILEKAKQGKNVDYNKERLKKVREAQYEILNNLDLELKKVEDAKRNNERKAEEDNLMNLINTITQLEVNYKEEAKKRETQKDLELLNLTDDFNTQEEPETSTLIEENLTKTQKEIHLVADSDKEEPINSHEEKSVEEEKEEKVEKTLSKLNIDLSSYDDFSDISKQDTGTIIIKIVIFIIIIALVVGAVYILNILLDLGLF